MNYCCNLFAMEIFNVVGLVMLLFQRVCNWLDCLEVRNYRLAHILCQVIPASCPFERKITLFTYTIINIPPLCKLNPFYEQLVNIRFKSLMYLADECGEDISIYC